MLNLVSMIVCYYASDTFMDRLFVIIKSWVFGIKMRSSEAIEVMDTVMSSILASRLATLLEKIEYPEVKIVFSVIITYFVEYMEKFGYGLDDPVADEETIVNGLNESIDRAERDFSRNSNSISGAMSMLDSYDERDDELDITNNVTQLVTSSHGW